MGWKLGEQKAQARMDTDFLDWALGTFAGYGAADARSDGPFCLLAAVAHRSDTRLLFEGWDHDPTHADLQAFLGRLNMALAARDLPLFGVTTEGAALSPAPLREVCGEGPHPIGTFPRVAEVLKAVLGAVASARQGLAAQQPTLGTGRPRTPAAQQAARTTKRLEAHRAGLFTQRQVSFQ